MAKLTNKNILITTSTFAEYDRKPLDILEQKGFQYKLNPFRRKLTGVEFLDLVGDCVGVVAGTEDLKADILTRTKSLKVISRCGTGMDNVDLKKAKELGIKVCNTPDVVTTPVAELTVGFILSLLRKIPLMDRQIRQGKWSKEMGSLLAGKKVGIVGFGRIGTAVAKILKAFDVEIYFYDPLKKKSVGGFKFLEIDKLLKTVDIVTLHMSGGEGNVKFLDAKKLAMMKKGSFVINCARGGLLDENALYDKLRAGYLGGAALDVFEEEPYQGLLKELDNVILTAHIGSYAREARINMELEAVNNLLKSLKEGKR